MGIELNHTIAWCSDKHRSSRFLAEILGLPEPKKFYHFQVVELSNGVSIDFYQIEGEIRTQHYAFLVSEAELNEIWARIKEHGIEFYPDPGHSRAGEINTNDGGRGLYFSDPDGHNLEIITRPYGSG
jgi:catechol 2,3-dioxygenase-like lactoylglutathione lyase family enzyme